MSEKLLMKHMGSCAPDLPLEYRIVESAKMVRVKAEQFDAAHLYQLALYLKERNIDLIHDDNAGWVPPRPTWRMMLDIGYKPRSCQVGLCHKCGSGSP